MILSYTAREVQLLSVDYGCSFVKLTKEVSGIPPDPEDLTTLPYQAIECHLATVLPLDVEWTPAAGDLVWDQCGFSEALYAKVRCTGMFSLCCATVG